MKRINNLKKNSYRIKICLKKSQSYSMMFMCQTNNHEKYINLIMLNNRLNNLLFSILLWFLKTLGYAGGSEELLAWYQKKPHFMVRYGWFPDHQVSPWKEACPMMDKNSLAHTQWRCKYHLVFAPKYRRQIIYGKYKRSIGEIIRELCERKNVE